MADEFCFDLVKKFTFKKMLDICILTVSGFIISIPGYLMKQKTLQTIAQNTPNYIVLYIMYINL